MFKKFVGVTMISLFTITTNGAYTSVDCSSDDIFGQYDCNECFDGGNVNIGDNISFLEDVWENNTQNDKIMYKEEQDMPVLNSLNGAKFTKNPDNDTFWEYTSELEDLMDTSYDGYVLPAGESKTWIKSKLGASYRVDNIPADGNAGILIFDLMAHNIIDNEIVMNDKSFKECILYKAGEVEASVVVKNEEPENTEIKPQEIESQDITKVPTGPEMYLFVLILSFILGFILMNKRLILEKIRK